MPTTEMLNQEDTDCLREDELCATIFPLITTGIKI